MTDWVPPMDRGLSALRHAGALLDFSMPPCRTTSPSMTWTTPACDWPRAPQLWARPLSDTCCKSASQTVQRRAVNQQTRTMTPKEAKTLLSVNMHRNSRLLNLERNIDSSEGEWALNSWIKTLSQIEKLHYLICTNSVFYDPAPSRAIWKMLLS